MILATRSLTVAYLRILIPLGHSAVDFIGAWKVWWRFSNGRMRRSQTTGFPISSRIVFVFCLM